MEKTQDDQPSTGVLDKFLPGNEHLFTDADVTKLKNASETSYWHALIHHRVVVYRDLALWGFDVAGHNPLYYLDYWHKATQQRSRCKAYIS